MVLSPNLIRILTATCSFFITWILTVNVMVFIVVSICNAVIYYTESIWNDLVVNWNGDDVFGLLVKLPYLPNHIDVKPYLICSFEIAGILLSLATLWFLLGSIRQAVLCVNIRAQKTTKEHPVYQLVKNICDKIGDTKIPAVYIAPNTAMNAFAISKPFRSAIILNDGILSIPKSELMWVIGHELGHIHYGDGYSSTLWLSIRQAERFAYNARYHFMNIAYPMILKIPFMILIAAPIRWLLTALVYISDHASSWVRSIFRILDSYAQREMEYRADKYACKVIQAKYGIDALYTLGGLVEAHFDVFASHPSMQKRIDRLALLQ